MLTASANSCGSENDYGKGLVDYAYALSIYDEYKDAYQENPSDITRYNIPENTNEAPVFEENHAVEGQWADHDGNAKNAGATLAFQNGAAAPDKESSGLKNLGDHHPWHGGRYANYAADYRYLVKVSNAVSSLGANAAKAQIVSAIKGVPASIGMDSGLIYDYEPMLPYKSEGVYLQMQKELCDNIAPVLVGMSATEKKGYVFGLASHIATDVFAHASYRYDGSNWKHIKHQDNPKAWNHADNILCVRRRPPSAKAVLDKIVDRFNGKRSDIAVVRDFLISKTTVAGNLREYYNAQTIKYTEDAQNEDATYRLHKIEAYLKTAGESDTAVLNVYHEVSYNYN